MPVTLYVDLCNIALSRIGTAQIESLTENNQNARYCALLLPEAINYVLCEADFSCCRKKISIDPDPSPPPDYDYQYTLPADLVRLITADTGDEPYEIQSGKLLTNSPSLILSYIFYPSEPLMLSVWVSDAIIKTLAFYLSTPLSSNEQIAQRLVSELQASLDKAKRREAQQLEEQGETYLTLCNVALNLIGIPTISSFTEENQIARICKTVVPSAVKHVLSEYDFTCCKKKLTIPPDGSPPPDYNYQYSLPADLVRIVNAETNGELYEVVGNKLYTNADSLVLTYVFYPAEPLILSAWVSDAIIKTIAYYLSGSTARSEEVLKLIALEAQAAIEKAKRCEPQRIFDDSESSFIGLCNIALNRLGASSIASLTEESQAARFCYNLLPAAIKHVLGEFDFSCCRKRVTLEPDVDPPGFGYAYQYTLPSDFIRVIAIEPGEYVLDVGKLFSNAEQLYLLYIFDPQEPLLLSPWVRDAITKTLTFYLAPPLNKEVKIVAAEYQAAIEKAKNIEIEQSYDDQPAGWYDEAR